MSRQPEITYGCGNLCQQIHLVHTLNIVYYSLGIWTSSSLEGCTHVLDLFQNTLDIERKNGYQCPEIFFIKWVRCLFCVSFEQLSYSMHIYLFAFLFFFASNAHCCFGIVSSYTVRVREESFSTAVAFSLSRDI